jgi:hypothetical protein
MKKLEVFLGILLLTSSLTFVFGQDARVVTEYDLQYAGELIFNADEDLQLIEAYIDSGSRDKEVLGAWFIRLIEIKVGWGIIKDYAYEREALKTYTLALTEFQRCEKLSKRYQVVMIPLFQ